MTLVVVGADPHGQFAARLARRTARGGAGCITLAWDVLRSRLRPSTAYSPTIGSTTDTMAPRRPPPTAGNRATRSRPELAATGRSPLCPR